MWRIIYIFLNEIVVHKGRIINLMVDAKPGHTAVILLTVHQEVNTFYINKNVNSFSF